MVEIFADKAVPVSSERDGMEQYSLEIQQYPLLTAQEEYDLAKRCAEGDKQAIHQLANANLRLVIKIANKYKVRGVPMLELIQQGNVGLLEAVKRFDYKMGTRFSTYATDWITGEILSYLADNDLIQMPDEIRKVMRIQTELQQEHGVHPTEAELAKACEISVERLRLLLERRRETCSLEAILEDENAPRPDVNFEREELRQMMESLLQRLNERQREVLRLHYGFVDGERYSFGQIGQKLGISRQRAREIEMRAIEILLDAGAGMEEYL